MKQLRKEICAALNANTALLKLALLVFPLLFTSCATTEQKPKPAAATQQTSAHPPLKRWEKSQVKTISLEQAPSIPDLATGKTRPPSGEEFEDQLSQSGHDWLYGPGLGRTMVNIGTAIVFPPYVLYLLGNAGLALAGYGPVYVTDALPEEPRSYVLGVYDGVTSVPGRVTALVADENYSTE